MILIFEWRKVVTDGWLEGYNDDELRIMYEICFQKMIEKDLAKKLTKEGKHHEAKIQNDR